MTVGRPCQHPFCNYFEAPNWCTFSLHPDGRSLAVRPEQCASPCCSLRASDGQAPQAIGSPSPPLEEREEEGRPWCLAGLLGRRPKACHFSMCAYSRKIMAGLFSSATLEQIRAASDIVDVLGS